MSRRTLLIIIVLCLCLVLLSACTNGGVVQQGSIADTILDNLKRPEVQQYLHP